MTIKRAQATERAEDHHGATDGEQIAPDADRHADPSGRPDAGRRRKPPDAQPVANNRSTTQEADTGNDLGGNTAGLCRSTESVCRHQREQAGADGQQRMHAQPSWLAMKLSLGTDATAKHPSEQQATKEL
jgi:hypothetical protein